MPKLAKKPALALGATALLVLGASGISAQARTSGNPSGTTPSGQRGSEEHHGPGGVNEVAMDTALANALGVSVADLQAALKELRSTESGPDMDAVRTDMATAIAEALGVPTATVQTVLDAQRPPMMKHERLDDPNGTTPGAEQGVPPTGTTPPDGGPRRGRGGPGFGGPGVVIRRGGPDQTALIAALATATGKTKSEVKAALAKVDEARDAAHEAREAEFAKQLAAKLGLDADKVTAALDTIRPVKPAFAAKVGTTQTK